jgi:hypothetical protein
MTRIVLRFEIYNFAFVGGLLIDFTILWEPLFVTGNQLKIESRLSRMFSMVKISRIPLAYAATSFSAAAMHNLFILYYVDLFLTVYKLDHTWFYFGKFFDSITTNQTR